MTKIHKLRKLRSINIPHSGAVEAEILRDEQIEAAQERRQNRIGAESESENEFDFERDCGARP